MIANASSRPSPRPKNAGADPIPPKLPQPSTRRETSTPLRPSAGVCTRGRLAQMSTTTLNFALTRTASRDWREGDRILSTRLDHDGNVAPWLELAADRGLHVDFADVTPEGRLDLEDLERKLADRTRVVSFPLASNAI